MSRLVDGRRRYTHANRAGNVHDPDDLGDWGPLNAVSAPPVYAFRLLNERERKNIKSREICFASICLISIPLCSIS